MPAARGRVDQFVNRALATINMSAANTLTFDQIRFAVGTFQGVALIIHRVEFYPHTATIRSFVAATDQMDLAIVTNDNLASLSPTDQDVVCMLTVTGLAANVELMKTPLVRDFADLPGGGLILPANPVYVGMGSAGFAAAGGSEVVLYYTFKQLSDKDYIELVQMMVPGNI